MSNGGTLQDLGMRSGEVYEITSSGLVARQATESEIMSFKRDLLISSLREYLETVGLSIPKGSLQEIDYLRPKAKSLCYKLSDDLGFLFDSIVSLCGNSMSTFFSDCVREIIREKCTEFDRVDLVEQYHAVWRELTSNLKIRRAVFEEYVDRMAEKSGLQNDKTFICLADSLGRFPLFYAIDKCIAKIEPKLLGIARNKLCIYRDSEPLSDEGLQAVSKYYSKIKYRIDAFIRKIQDEIEPLGCYFGASSDYVNASERTNFSSSFHHYICTRLIPNLTYYGSLRPRVPDWVFTTKGREYFYATPKYSVGIKNVLDEALSSRPSLALEIENGDIRFCFDRTRYKLSKGEGQFYSLSGFCKLSKAEMLDRFKQFSSEHIIVPKIVEEECNRMLSILSPGKHIENYILRSE